MPRLLLITTLFAFGAYIGYQLIMPKHLRHRTIFLISKPKVVLSARAYADILEALQDF